MHGPGLDRGVVFQQYALFPWRTAQANVEFGLEVKGVGRKQRRERAREVLDLVGLAGFADRYPHELSGGMKQRVAIARSLAYEPEVLLMDEPYAALDAQTRESLQDELLAIWRRTGTTIVFITHSIDEAVYLGERVAVMTSRPGRIKATVDVRLTPPAAGRGPALHRAVHRQAPRDLAAAARRGRQGERDRHPRATARGGLMTSTLDKPVDRRRGTPVAPRKSPRRRPGRKWVTSWIAVAVLLACGRSPRARLGRPDLPAAAEHGARRLVAARAERRTVDRRARQPAALADRLRHRAAVGVPLGLLIGWYRLAAELLSPVLVMFLNTAAIALLPVFTLILGHRRDVEDLDHRLRQHLADPLNTISGVRTVDPLLIKSARSLGLSHLRLFQKVILPASVPTIFTGVRLAGAASILVLITTEMVGAKAGLGYLILNSQHNFQIPQMYAGILTVSAIGVAFNYLLFSLERRFSTWRSA